MKTLLFFILVMFFCSPIVFAQKTDHNADGSGNVILSTNKVEVIEYIGKPKANVCGLGEHFHDAHLTVALTDAEVLITSPEGEQQNAKIPSGASIWFEEGTHSVTNEGNNDTKLLLVYLQE